MYYVIQDADSWNSNKIGESYFITSSYMQGTKYSLQEHTNSPSYIKQDELQIKARQLYKHKRLSDIPENYKYILSRNGTKRDRKS